jgi:hypothetical protein
LSTDVTKLKVASGTSDLLAMAWLVENGLTVGPWTPTDTLIELHQKVIFITKIFLHQILIVCNESKNSRLWDSKATVATIAGDAKPLISSSNLSIDHNMKKAKETRVTDPSTALMRVEKGLCVLIADVTMLL